MNEIISYLVGKVANRTPSFILFRLLPPAKVARQIRANLSNLKLTLDRLLVDVWFCQPTFEGIISRRYVVPPREIVTNIYYRQSLTPGQKARIESCQTRGANTHPPDCVLRDEGRSRRGGEQDRALEGLRPQAT